MPTPQAYEATYFQQLLTAQPSSTSTHKSLTPTQIVIVLRQDT
jgi:hypothetical protein